jgi:hypothetical protein
MVLTVLGTVLWRKQPLRYGSNLSHDQRISYIRSSALDIYTTDYFAACDTFCPSTRATAWVVSDIWRNAKAIVSSSEALDHSTATTEGRIACERSGGYADSLPCEKTPLSKGSRVELTIAFLSSAQRRAPQSWERIHILVSRCGNPA